MPRIYVENGQRDMIQIFLDLGWECVSDMDKVDALCLIGGADIHPSWYDSPRHPYSGGNLHRDERTDNLFIEATEKGIPIIGICRGGQFLNARVGGGMYQHVDGHAGGWHRLLDEQTKCYHEVNSLHHQMIIPTDRAVLIARAVAGKNDTNIASFREIAVYEGEELRPELLIVNVPVSEEAPEWEVVYYPEVKGLCFQAHPEYDDYKGACRQYFYEVMKRVYPQFF